MAMEGVFVLYVFHPPPLLQVDIFHYVTSHISHTSHTQSILLLLAALYGRHCQV